ncbi:MAG: TIGR03086 family metal-binding protein [Mycobacteriales bacterium]
MVGRSDAVFLGGLDFFGAAVARLAASDWDRPSPCAGWRALDVVGHIGSAVRFGTKLLLEEGPVWEPLEPPGAAVEGDPGSWWQRLVGPAREAVSGVELSRVVDSPMGRRSIEEGLSFPALDLFVHAWDLSRVVGAEVEIPAEAIEFARRVIDPIPAEQVRSPGVFAAAVAPAPDATPTQRFIAWTGRDPRWAPVP